MSKNAYNRLRARIVEKELKVNRLENEIKGDAWFLAYQLQPKNLLLSAVQSMARSAVRSPALWKNLAAAGAVYGAERWIFRKSHPMLKTAGMFAIRRVVSKFIDPLDE